MRRATFTDGTSGCSASALHGELARAGERGLDRRALDVLDRLDQRAGVAGHLADRDRDGAGAADDARHLDHGALVEERQAAAVRDVEDQHRALVAGDRLDDGHGHALVAAVVLRPLLGRRPAAARASAK